MDNRIKRFLSINEYTTRVYRVYVQESAAHGVIGTGSQLSACSLIELLFANLLLILSVNNPIHMYLSDLRVYF